MLNFKICCKDESHTNIDAQSICINNNCQQCRVCCQECLLKYHSQHQDDYIDMKQLQEWLSKKGQVFITLQKSFNQLQLILNSLTVYLNNQRHEDDSQNIQATNIVNEMITKVLKVDELEQNLLNYVDKAIIQLEKAKINLCNGEQLLGTQQEQFHNDLLQNHRTQFQFSPTLKQKNIYLSKSGKLAETSDKYYQYCICEPEISQVGITKIAFKIIKGVFGVFIGLCHKSMVLNANYNLNYKEIGHGEYSVNLHGQTLSNLQKEYNQVCRSFKFFDGDIIIIEADIPNKKVTWIRKQTNENFSMDLDTTKDLYPFVSLRLSCVEIDDSIL